MFSQVITTTNEGESRIVGPQPRAGSGEGEKSVTRQLFEGLEGRDKRGSGTTCVKTGISPWVNFPDDFGG